MDFVVIGFGLGALILLIGLAVSDLAPRLSHAQSESESDRQETVPSNRRHFALAKDAPAVWGRACRSLGQVIMIGGGAVVVATVIGIVGQLTDRNGARLVLAAILLAFAATVLRAGQLVNGIYGADRRARARSFRPPAPPIVDDEPHADEEAADPPADGADQRAPLVAPAAEMRPEPAAANGAATPLPDLRTLLGGSERRRDEIVTLEQFLGLAPESSPAGAGNGSPAHNGAAPADSDGQVSEATSLVEHAVEAEPDGAPESVSKPVSTERGDDDAEISDRDTAAPPAPPASKPEPAMNGNSDDNGANAEESDSDQEAADGQGSAESSPSPTQPVAHT